MTDEFGGVKVADAPPDTDEFGGVKVVTPPAIEADQRNVPQLRSHTPTIGDRTRDLLHTLRTSDPVEKILGRTAEEIAAEPALESAPATTDAGVMGLFASKTPLSEGIDKLTGVDPVGDNSYEQPTTALEGLHNWAAGVVNSVASPGGIVTVPLTGPAKLMGPVVQRAMLLTFGAQGAKMTYDAAKDLVNTHAVQRDEFGGVKLSDGKTRTSAQTVMDVGNILAGGLMTLGGAGALKGSKPVVEPPAPERPAEDWLPPVSPDVPTTAEPFVVDDFGGIKVPESRAEPVTPPPAVETPTPAGDVSPMVTQALNETMSARQPVPVTLLAQAGIAPTALAEGYALNADGTHFEFTEPPVKLTPEQEAARANVQAMAELRAQKGGEATAPVPEPVASEPAEGTVATKLIPVDVSAGKVKAFAEKVDRAPDVLDAIADHFPDGVKFGREDFGDAVKQSRGAAAELMSHTEGEPSDQALDGLHREGLFRNIETESQLADAMKEAGDRRIAERSQGSTAARTLAEDAKRTEMFEAAAFKPRKVASEPVIVSGIRSNDRITIEVDGGSRIPTSAELTQKFKALGHDVEFSEVNSPVAQGRNLKRFRGTVRNEQGQDSSSAAKQAFKTAFGQDENFTGKAARQSSTVPSEPIPAGQLFVGDEFKLHGSPVRVIDQVLDAETGKPSHVEVDGAYGRQNIPADALVYVDTGSVRSPSLGQTIIAGLDKLKLDTRGQLHAFGLLPEVWNTAVDSIKLLVRGGMALKAAIDHVIKNLKGSGLTGPDFDEAGAREHLARLGGQRQFTEQLDDAQDISDGLKEAVTNTLYTRRPQETDTELASRLIDSYGGVDQARLAFQNRSNDMPAPVRIALGMQILKRLDAAGRHADAAQFFDNDFAPHTTDVAQGLAMLNAWGSMSKDGKLVWARKKLADAARDTIAPVQPDIDAAATELRRQNLSGIEHATVDPAVQTSARAAVTDAVANSAETHTGIVMELVEPWASAKVILDMARAQVAAKANDILTKQPRPMGFTTAKHLAAIMDDLAKRAADIAAGHYRGAEPGVILRDKLVQRLGISQDAATKLATALDKEFQRQVKAAENALPKRIAAAIERQKQGLANAEEKPVDKSIRQQLAKTKQTLGTVIRNHWTKATDTKTDLVDKLVKQAGLSGDEATKLADMIQRRFDALTAKAKADALNKILKPLKRLGLAKVALVEKLVKLSNVGAFDDKSFYDAIKERMNLPAWTEELRKQLDGLAERIGKLPADKIEDLQRLQTEFLSTVERAKGISNLELGLAFYMQNILSGLTTHVRVAIHTSAQMVAAITAEVGQAVAENRLADVPLIFEALGRGAGKALTQQKDILRSGLVVGSKLQHIVPFSVLEQIHFGREGGTTVRQGRMAKALLENKLATILNLWKYNGRLITAQHMIYFKPAEEMKLALLATRQARTEGLSGRNAVDRARQMLGYGAAEVRAAEAQAIREGLDGTKAKMRVSEILQGNLPPMMKVNARDYALRQTFLNEPYGFPGAIANLVANAKQSSNAKLATAAKVIVPFTRIAANVFNEGLNYTPVGAMRAKLGKTELLGHKFADIDPEVRDSMRRELYAKSALGTTLLTAIAYKAAQGLNQPDPSFTVYGAGPANPDDKSAWRASGAIPYSVKVGDRYLSYANTPGNVMLASLGNYLDGMRDAVLYKRPGAQRLAEDLPMRAAAATMGAGKVVMEQPFLASLMDIADMAKESNPEISAKSAIKTVTRTASSFVVPNLLRQVDRFYDPTSYDQKDLAGILTGQVPFVRQTGHPRLNALGQPIPSPVFGMFESQANPDPLVQLLSRHNAWPSAPDPNRTAVNGVPLSDEEFYLYAKTRGTALETMLRQPAVADMLARLDKATDSLTLQANAATNPVVKARITAMAAHLQNGLMEKYEAAANKQASAAVVKSRGY